jgi:hypothetical protein
MTPLELLARLAALVPPPRFPLLRYFGVFAANSPWRAAIVPRPPDASAPCRHTHGAGAPTDPPPPSTTPATPDSSDPLLAVPPSVPRTLSADHWQHLDDGLLLARQPRVDWASLLRRTFAEDVLSCPRCRGRMALIEVLIDEAEIRRSLTKLGLSCPGRRSLGEGDAPVSFAPPRVVDDGTPVVLRRFASRGETMTDMASGRATMSFE